MPVTREAATARDLGHDPTWPAIRRAFLASLPSHPRCHRCQGIISGPIHVDHDPPFALTGTHTDLFPAHPSCNSSAGGRLGNDLQRVRAQLRGDVDALFDLSAIGVQVQVAVDADPSPGPDDPRWQVPWLADLLAVPDDATWPTFQTAPHPDAVGSLGQLFESWVDGQGRQLRWWQRLAARRLLEHDADGHLVWLECLLTVSRQSGKSVLLRELLSWRLLSGGDLFGEAQTLLHIASTEAIALEVQRPFRIWGKGNRDLVTVREQNGQNQVERIADGSRWLVKASKAVYGLSASVAAVDEAWNVAPAIVDDGLVPVMLERCDPQLLLFSTAHRQATGLVLDRRAACLRDLAVADEALLLEWSAAPDRDDDDEVGWREASPHWSDRRRRLIVRQLEQARSGASIDPDEPDPLQAFRSQYLNRWPVAKRRAKRGQPLFGEGTWAGLRADGDTVERDDSPIVVAVEDTSGDRASTVAAVELDDGRVAVWGQQFDRRADAIAYAVDLAAKYDEGALATILVGASMAADPALSQATCRVLPVGTREFRTGLPLLRSVVAGGRVRHDGGGELARQVDAVRVLEGPAGLSLVGGVRADMLRCLVWAVQASTVRPWVAPAIH